MPVPSAPRPSMGSGGAQALEPRPTSSSTIASEPWRRGSPTVGHTSTSGAVLSSQRTHWTRASYRPKRCSTAIKGKPGRNSTSHTTSLRFFPGRLSLGGALPGPWRSTYSPQPVEFMGISPNQPARMSQTRRSSGRQAALAQLRIEGSLLAISNMCASSCRSIHGPHG